VISVTQVCKFETPALQQGFGKSTVLICVTSLWRYPPYFNYVKQFWCSSLAIYAWELSISVRFKHQWALHAHGVSCLKSGGWFSHWQPYLTRGTAWERELLWPKALQVAKKKL